MKMKFDRTSPTPRVDNSGIWHASMLVFAMASSGCDHSDRSCPSLGTEQDEEKLVKELAALEVDSILHHIDLSERERDKLHAHFVEMVRINRDPRRSPTLDDLDIVEAILGSERYRKLGELRGAELRNLSKGVNDLEVLHLTRILDLTASQQQTLRESYERPDRDLERNAAAVAEAAGADDSLLPGLRSILSRSFLEEAGASGRAPAGAAPADYLRIASELRVEALRTVLDEAQIERYKASGVDSRL